MRLPGRTSVPSAASDVTTRATGAEVIPIDDELAEAVRESRPDIAPLLKKRGITTLKDSALDLFLSGQTSLEEVLPLLRE